MHTSPNYKKNPDVVIREEEEDAALLFNPGKIIATGRSDKKLEKIKNWAPNIIETVSSTADNVRGRILEITGGSGADCLIDYSPKGITNVCIECLNGLRKCGRAVFVGGNDDSLDISYAMFMQRGITITGSIASLYPDHAEFLKLTSQGKLEFDDMITHRFPLSKVNDMFETLDKKIGEPMWIVGLPQEE